MPTEAQLCKLAFLAMSTPCRYPSLKRVVHHFACLPEHRIPGGTRLSMVTSTNLNVYNLQGVMCTLLALGAATTKRSADGVSDTPDVHPSDKPWMEDRTKLIH